MQNLEWLQTGDFDRYFSPAHSFLQCLGLLNFGGLNWAKRRSRDEIGYRASRVFNYITDRTYCGSFAIGLTHVLNFRIDISTVHITLLDTVKESCLRHKNTYTHVLELSLGEFRKVKNIIKDRCAILASFSSKNTTTGGVACFYIRQAACVIWTVSHYSYLRIYYECPGWNFTSLKYDTWFKK